MGGSVGAGVGDEVGEAVAVPLADSSVADAPDVADDPTVGDAASEGEADSPPVGVLTVGSPPPPVHPMRITTAVESATAIPALTRIAQPSLRRASSTVHEPHAATSIVPARATFSTRAPSRPTDSLASLQAAVGSPAG
jgi:hypothetical protein